MLCPDPKQSVTDLISHLIGLVKQRWSSQLAVDLQSTICRCLTVLGNNCPVDTASVYQRKVLIIQIYQLLIQRVGTGFQFDEASSGFSQQLHYLTVDARRSINTPTAVLGGGGLRLITLLLVKIITHYKTYWRRVIDKKLTWFTLILPIAPRSNRLIKINLSAVLGCRWWRNDWSWHSSYYPPPG